MQSYRILWFPMFSYLMFHLVDPMAIKRGWWWFWWCFFIYHILLFDVQGGFRVAPKISRRKFRAERFAPEIINPSPPGAQSSNVWVTHTISSLRFHTVSCLGVPWVAWRIPGCHRECNMRFRQLTDSRRKFRAENSAPETGTPPAY